MSNIIPPSIFWRAGLLPKKGIEARLIMSFSNETACYVLRVPIRLSSDESWRHKGTIMEYPLAVKEQVKRHLSSTPIPTSGPSPPNSPGGHINTLLSFKLQGFTSSPWVASSLPKTETSIPKTIPTKHLSLSLNVYDSLVHFPSAA
jgi:hypothetical protein